MSGSIACLTPGSDLGFALNRIVHGHHVLRHASGSGVNHPAVQLGSAPTLGGCLLEGDEDAFGSIDLGDGGRENIVGEVNLGRMDSLLPLVTERGGTAGC